MLRKMAREMILEAGDAILSLLALLYVSLLLSGVRCARSAQRVRGELMPMRGKELPYGYLRLPALWFCVV